MGTPIVNAAVNILRGTATIPIGQIPGDAWFQLVEEAYSRSWIDEVSGLSCELHLLLNRWNSSVEAIPRGLTTFDQGWGMQTRVVTKEFLRRHCGQSLPGGAALLTFVQETLLLRHNAESAPSWALWRVCWERAPRNGARMSYATKAISSEVKELSRDQARAIFGWRGCAGRTFLNKLRSACVREREFLEKRRALLDEVIKEVTIEHRILF